MFLLCLMFMCVYIYVYKCVCMCVFINLWLLMCIHGDWNFKTLCSRKYSTTVPQQRSLFRMTRSPPFSNSLLSGSKLVALLSRVLVFESAFLL